MSLTSIRFTPSMNLDQLTAALNDNFAGLENINITQIFKDDTGTPRVILGKAPDGTYGLKVSKVGVDVTKATDDQLIFNSSQNIFKIAKVGTTTTPTYTVTSAVGQWVNSVPGGVLTIPHNLGYVPSVVAYSKAQGTTDQYILLPTNFQSISGPNGFMINRVAVNVDSTNLYVIDTTITNGAVATTSAGGLDIKYYLLQESAT